MKKGDWIGWIVVIAVWSVMVPFLFWGLSQTRYEIKFGRVIDVHYWEQESGGFLSHSSYTITEVSLADGTVFVENKLLSPLVLNHTYAFTWEINFLGRRALIDYSELG